MTRPDHKSPKKVSRKTFIFAALLILSAIVPASGEGLRNIASLTVDYFLDGNYSIETVDVFLARLTPAFSIQAKLSRLDTPGAYRHTIGVGPIVNFTQGLYTDIRYSFCLDSMSIVSHEAEVNLTNETDTSSLSCGIRGSLFPDSSYWFLIPTTSGSLLLFDSLHLFGKVFVSINSDNRVTGSFWGETGWSFNSTVTARAGFTLSYMETLGYTVLGGIDLRFNENFLIKYTVQFLANTISRDSTMENSYGIQNVLIADIKF